MTISLYLTRPTATAPTAIYALIFLNARRFKYYSREQVHPNNWSTEKHRTKRSFTGSLELNQRLNDFEATIQKTYRRYVNDRGEEPSPALLRALLDKEFFKSAEQDEYERKLKTFWGFFDDFLQRSENGTRLHIQNHTPLAANTIKNFRNLKAHLKNFEQAKKKKIDFDVIDLKFYQAFTGYLTISKGLGINTIGKLITNLKVLLREAWEAGATANTNFTHRKFRSYQVQTDAVYLTEAEIQALQKLDLSNSSRHDKVRDMFVIGCYTGLRFSDFSRLSYSHIIEGVIHITQVKTAAPLYIPVRAELKEMFKKYPDQLPTAMTNQEFNRVLKEVCRRCDALQEEVTINKIAGGRQLTVSKPKYEFVQSHTARRSFATNEYMAGDLQPFEIRAITGHKTDKAFYKYIRMTPKENAANVARKWEEREAQKMKKVPQLKAV